MVNEEIFRIIWYNFDLWTCDLILLY